MNRVSIRKYQDKPVEQEKPAESEFKDIENLFYADIETLTALSDFGLITAQSVVDFFCRIQTRAMIDALKAAGVKTTLELEEQTDTRFAGMTFVLTGALTKFTRDEATEKIELLGGKASGSVSKKTSYVVVGENAGSKERKARELGIPILSEDDFLAMIQG